jgi:hypothetical protein
MNTKKIIANTTLLILIFSICGYSQKVKKTPCYFHDIPLGYYYPFETYAYITDSTWSLARNKLKQVVLLPSPKKIDEWEIQNSEEANCIINKVADINWKGKEKQEVTDFLKNTIVSLFKYQGILKEEDKKHIIKEDGCPISIGESIFIPYNMLWAIQKIDKKEGFNTVTEIWDKFKYDNEYDAWFRYLALQNMDSICLVEPKVIDFLTKIKNSTEWQPLSQQDVPRKMIERMLLKDLLFKEKNKIKRWQFLYQTLKEDKNVDILNNKNASFFYEKYDIAKEVESVIDIKLLFQLVKNSQSEEEKYFFLYMLSRNLYDKIALDGSSKNQKILKQYKKEVQQFYSENPQAKINQKDKPKYFLNAFANEFKKYETQ